MDYLFYGHLKPVFLISQITLTHNICFDNTVDGATTEIENLNSFFLLSSSPTRFPTRIHTHNESDECKRVQFSSLLSRLCSYVKIIKNKDFALAEIRTLHLRVSRRILTPGPQCPGYVLIRMFYYCGINLWTYKEKSGILALFKTLHTRNS